jgi:tetratricopeptide (TPR) repeat protein
MAQIVEEVRELIRKRAPMEALALIKKEGPEEVRKVTANLFEDITAVNSLDERWRDTLSLVYYSYFSFITSDLVDIQSLTECAISSLNAAKICRKMNFPELESTFLFNAAQALNNMSLNERAIKCYQEAERILSSMGEGYLRELAAVLNNLGAVYIETKRIDEAEKYIVKALEIRRKLAEEDEVHLPELAETLSNAGAVFGERGEYELSEKYYNESISIFRRLSDSMFHKANLAAVLNNFSIVLRRLRRYEEAESCVLEALNIFKELSEVSSGFREMCAEIYSALGLLYNDMGKRKEAEECYRKSKAIYKEIVEEKARQKINSYKEHT